MKKLLKKIEEYNPNIIIIDLSADYRFDKNWTYSIPEICKPAKKNRISNPGCYASAIQFSLFPITKMFFEEGNPGGVKASLAKQGIMKPFMRMPLYPVSEGLKNRIEQETARLITG